MNDKVQKADQKGVSLPLLGELPMERVINFASHKYWGVSDPARFKALMDEARSLVTAGHFLGDNLFTWGRNNSALDDAAFRSAWESNIQNDADQAIVWRRYILACAADSRTEEDQADAVKSRSSVSHRASAARHDRQA